MAEGCSTDRFERCGDSFSVGILISISFPVHKDQSAACFNTWALLHWLREVVEVAYVDGGAVRQYGRNEAAAF